jgi:TorA maturation chaperone TorD
VGSLSESEVRTERSVDGEVARDRRPEARSRAYAALLGRPARALELARLAPSLASAIDGARDRDELLADHEHVFGFSCPPFESLFLDPEGTSGHDPSLRAALAGVDHGPNGEEPDHLATMLAALGTLSGAEADALDDRRPDIVARIHDAARGLLDRHLLRWLPSFVLAVERTGRRWPIALARTVLDLVLEHRSTLGPPRDAAFELPGAALALDEPDVGIAEIARYLALPARSGFFFSRDDLTRLSREVRAPKGFADRGAMMENLLRSAADLEVLAALVDRAGEALDAHAAALASDRFEDAPLEVRRPWIDRIAVTRAILARLR